MVREETTSARGREIMVLTNQLAELNELLLVGGLLHSDLIKEILEMSDLLLHGHLFARWVRRGVSHFVRSLRRLLH